MSRCIPMARSRGRPARPPSSAAARARTRSFDVPSTVGGLAFAPKGLRLAIAHYNGVTLWFPNMAANAGIAGMGRLASRRHLQPGQQVPGHHDARAGAAWLAARRQPAHAHDRLSRPRPLDVVERRRQGAGDLRRRHRDHLAVRQQGRPDGQGARDAGAAAGARLRRSPAIRSRTSWPPATATAPC